MEVWIEAGLAKSPKKKVKAGLTRWYANGCHQCRWCCTCVKDFSVEVNTKPLPYLLIAKIEK